jgi:hypothetical protein
MPEVFCENCDSYQPVVEHEPQQDERNPYPWYDITCGTCDLIIATLQIVPDEKPIEPAAMSDALVDTPILGGSSPHLRRPN